MTVTPGQPTFSWPRALGIAGYELAVSARTPVFWAAPGLWVLVLISQIHFGGGDLRTGLQSAGGGAYIAGFLAAALAVTLPARTKAAAAQDIVGVMPAERSVAAGRMLAAMAAAALLVLCAPLGGVIFALVGGSPTAGFLAALPLYLALSLPAAWVGAGLGLLAGQMLSDTRLAMLAVFVGGVGAFVANIGQFVLTPLGAFDMAVRVAVFTAVPWPFGGLLPWHVATLVGVAGLAGMIATSTGGWNRFGKIVAGVGVGVFLVGFIGYQFALAPIQVGPDHQAAQPSLPWALQRMDVTLDVGKATTGTAMMVLQNTGSAPLAQVRLHMPAGLNVIAAHLDGGRSLAPGPVLLLPSTVAPGATVDITVAYDGRWTAFASRASNSLRRAVGPSHVVLLSNDVLGWAPHPEAGSDVPVTLRLTGQVPAATFCNLTPTAPNTWSGDAGHIQCIGANLRERHVGSVNIWTDNPGSGLTRDENLVLTSASRCLGVSGAVAGMLPVPVISQAWTDLFDFRRYRDPEMVVPVMEPIFASVSFLPWEDGVEPVWGPGGTASIPGDPSLRLALISLLQETVNREQGVAGFVNTSLVPSSPGGRDVQAAMAHMSSNAACRLLGTLHTLDVSGKLTDAAVAQAVAGAKE